MTTPESTANTNGCPERYRALLAVSEAIVAYHDLPVLFHELGQRLHQVVSFDFLALILYAATNTVRQHVLEACEPVPVNPASVPADGTPAGIVLQTQQLIIISGP